jgi:glutamate:GABA antiporter
MINDAAGPQLRRVLGGLYVWSKLAFGPFAGFMTGWGYWTANLPYLPGVLYFAGGGGG